MAKNKLDAITREAGENLTQLRLNQILPANIFGPNRDSVSIKVESHLFRQIHNEVGESGVAYLQLDGQEIPVMVEEVQREPVTDAPIHVSFKVVDLKKTITAEIPVEVIGECEVVEAVLVVVRDEVEVEALPTDLPEKFEVDVSSLSEIGQSITLNDLDYDAEKVRIVVGDEGVDAPVVLLQEVEEEPEEPEEPIETEIIGEAEEPAAEGEVEAESEEAVQNKKDEEPGERSEKPGGGD